MITAVRPAFDWASYALLDDAVLVERIERVRHEMGPRLLILGHHYQCDEILRRADLCGDSYILSALAAGGGERQAIVFCGVHFMAETADILANRPERLAERSGLRVPVSLPDLRAGCSLANSANLRQVERCWAELAEIVDTDDLAPIAYINSTARLKAFCGRHGGIVCTSSNARAALDWAFERHNRVVFFPDQHLGRNTARAMGIAPDQMPLWNPYQGKLGGNSADAIRRSRVILWDGCCCVHQRFLPNDVARVRKDCPGVKIMVHPECMAEVVELADAVGSTTKIIQAVEQSPPGTHWAIGTESHLVDRLRREHPEQHIELLSEKPSLCGSMSRITLSRLCWTVENIAAGTPVNVIEVEPDTAHWALESLQRMLAVK